MNKATKQLISDLSRALATLNGQEDLARMLDVPLPRPPVYYVGDIIGRLTKHRHNTRDWRRAQTDAATVLNMIRNYHAEVDAKRLARKQAEVAK